MAALSTIYPPIVPDIKPAFLTSTTCYIFFNLSQYTNIDEIDDECVHITINNQKTNKSLLDKALYPSGIKLAQMYRSEDGDTSDSIFQSQYHSLGDNYAYYVTIEIEDISQILFPTNEFYKVQLRFTKAGCPKSNPSLGTAEWFELTDYFSEWSTVTLVKAISQPSIQLVNLVHYQNQIQNLPSFSTLSNIVGKLTFTQPEEKEYLKSYNINIRYFASQSDYINPAKSILIFQSQEIFANTYNINEINYEITHELEKGKIHIVEISYTTNNLYTASSTFYFKLLEEQKNELPAVVEITPEENLGRMKISISFKALNTENNLIIKRTSSKTSFSQWETIKILQHNKNVKHLWYDTTIESGVWYKYRIQQDIPVNAKISFIQDPFICVFEDIFLTNTSRQLKVQFNPTISDFRYNVNESQQVTLGSQFPYIKRNGNNYYRSFSIGGLISALMDEQGWYDPNYHDNWFYHKNTNETFTSPEQIYGRANVTLYNDYNEQNNITRYQDYIYEKEFRQKVLEFLYENNIKLFRSLTQGNMLIKLTNISLSPVETLGRMLYSFSATATEIDKNTLENLKKYNLINKFYYTYLTYSITDEFECEKSLINRLYEELQMSLQMQSLTDIMQLKFIYNGNKEIAIFAKPKNNKNLFRYLLTNGSLILTYSDEDPVAECYFYGIHLNPGEYTETQSYYSSTDEITNPQNNYVYYIPKSHVYKIDNYVQYYRDADLLVTYPEEVHKNSQDNYALLVGADYYQVIYYNNSWHVFSKDQDVLMNKTPSITVEYLYRIKKEG